MDSLVHGPAEVRRRWGRLAAGTQVPCLRDSRKGGLDKIFGLTALDDMPTGPHTPVSNLVTEIEAFRGKLISTPEAGEAPGVVDPRENGTEELWPEVRPESSAGAPQAPSTEGLADIGAASFGQPGVQLETVHGIDDRVGSGRAELLRGCRRAARRVAER